MNGNSFVLRLFVQVFQDCDELRWLRLHERVIALIVRMRLVFLELVVRQQELLSPVTVGLAKVHEKDVVFT